MSKYLELREEGIVVDYYNVLCFSCVGLVHWV